LVSFSPRPALFVYAYNGIQVAVASAAIVGGGSGFVAYD
jgi:hypothetical protein